MQSPTFPMPTATRLIIVALDDDLPTSYISHSKKKSK